MRIILFLFSVVFFFPTYTFSQKLEWANAFGGTGQDRPHDVAIDSDGNVYSTGFFRNTVDFDPGLGTTIHTSVSQSDLYVSKFDSSGNFQWVRVLGSSGNDESYSLAIDGQQNVYITGHGTGLIDMDPGPGTFNLGGASGGFGFIWKLNPQGSFLWAKGFDGNFRIKSIFIDANGNIICGGSFNNTVDFDPGPGTMMATSAGSSDFFVLKLNGNGNYLWSHAFGSTGLDYTTSVKATSNGDIFISGSFAGTIDFDPGPGIANQTSVGNSDYFVLKLDSIGNYVWAIRVGNNFSDNLFHLTLGNSGNLYLSASITGIVDFDPGPGIYNLGNTTNSFTAIVKLDSSANFIWGGVFQGEILLEGRPITLDNQENIYICGLYSNTVDFDPGPGTYLLTSNGNFDMYMLKLDSSGNFINAISFGGISSDVCFAVITMGDYVYMATSFRDTVDFDPTHSIAHRTSLSPQEMICIVKLGNCFPNASSITESTCSAYTSPSGRYVWNVSGQYQDTIHNTSGCDSVITIQLTITPNDTSISQNGITLFASESGATYQWLDCDNGMMPLAGMTAQSFTATANGNYAVAITKNGCTDTSECYSITGVGVYEYSPEKFSLFPNPTNGSVTLTHSLGSDGAEIVVTSVEGRILQRRVIEENSDEIILDYPSGIYFISVSKNGMLLWQDKVVKLN